MISFATLTIFNNFLSTTSLYTLVLLASVKTFSDLITDATLKFPPTVSDDDLDSIQISLPPTLAVLLASLSRSFPHARPSSSLSSPPSFSRLIPPVLTPFIVQLYRHGVFRVDARLRAIIFIPGARPLNVRRSGPGMTVRTGGTQNCAHVIPLSTASDSAFIYASRVNADSSSSHPPHDTLSPELDTPPMDFHRRAPRASSPPLRLLRRIEFLHLRVPPTGVCAHFFAPTPSTERELVDALANQMRLRVLGVERRLFPTRSEERSGVPARCLRPLLSRVGAGLPSCRSLEPDVHPARAYTERRPAPTRLVAGCRGGRDWLVDALAARAADAPLSTSPETAVSYPPSHPSSQSDPPQHHMRHLGVCGFLVVRTLRRPSPTRPLARSSTRYSWLGIASDGFSVPRPTRVFRSLWPRWLFGCFSCLRRYLYRGVFSPALSTAVDAPGGAQNDRGLEKPTMRAGFSPRALSLFSRRASDPRSISLCSRAVSLVLERDYASACAGA
ncbi:hypothetical protein C8J57DRAFT_1622199 [Mycena rebaudengoi]|nr:hypothetical protein C8J57DRAFT_1622199 [Mycena rebaudengoi]